MPCVLRDRVSKEEVGSDATCTDWIKGEYEVTPSVDPTSDANWNFAREAAITQARKALMARYSCGGTCETEGHFCVLDVRIVDNATGELVRRMIDNDPESFPYRQLGQKASEHLFLTYEVQAVAFCRCSSPPVRPAQPGGHVEHYGPPLPAPSSATPSPYGSLKFDLGKYGWGYPYKWGLGLDYHY